MTENQFSF